MYQFPIVQGYNRRVFFPLSSFQYFEYTSHQELRHNIGKQLCLHAKTDGVTIELCQLKGKGTHVAPEQQWIFTEVRPHQQQYQPPYPWLKFLTEVGIS